MIDLRWRLTQDSSNRGRLCRMRWFVILCISPSVGVCCACFRLDSCSCWCALVWPGTSLGSPASVMTEGPWLGVTSCGSPGSCVMSSADWPEPRHFFFLCAGSRVCGWMDALPWEPWAGYYLHLIVSVWQSLTEILEAPQVSSALRPWPGRTAAGFLSP